jgi:uncharacterized OB-fold protein
MCSKCDHEGFDEKVAQELYDKIVKKDRHGDSTRCPKCGGYLVPVTYVGDNPYCHCPENRDKMRANFAPHSWSKEKK